MNEHCNMWDETLKGGLQQDERVLQLEWWAPQWDGRTSKHTDKDYRLEYNGRRWEKFKERENTWWLWQLTSVDDISDHFLHLKQQQDGGQIRDKKTWRPMTVRTSMSPPDQDGGEGECTTCVRRPRVLARDSTCWPLALSINGRTT